MIKSFVVSKGRQSTWCDPLSCGCRCYWRSITGGSLRQIAYANGSIHCNDSNMGTSVGSTNPPLILNNLEKDEDKQTILSFQNSV